MQLRVMFCIGPPLMQWAGQTSPEMNQRFAVKEASLYRTTSHLQQNAQSQMNKSLVVKLVEYWPEKSILLWPWPQSTLIRSHALNFCFPFYKYLSKTSIWKPFRAFLKSRVVVLWIHATLWFEAIWKKKAEVSGISTCKPKSNRHLHCLVQNGAVAPKLLPKKRSWYVLVS